MMANIFLLCPYIKLYNAPSLDILNFMENEKKIIKEFEPYSIILIHL